MLDQESEPTQIVIDASGQIFVDDIAIMDVELAATFVAIAEQPSGPEGHAVFLRADTGLDYGRVMLVMGELNRAGLNRISLVTTAPGDALAVQASEDDIEPGPQESELLPEAEVESI